MASGARLGPPQRRGSSGCNQQADLTAEWFEYAGPGHWNDPDLLEVGNGHMSAAEYRSQFAIWALMKAPLLISTDVTKMSDETLAILPNAEVITSCAS